MAGPKQQPAVSPGLLRLLDRFQSGFIAVMALLAVVLAVQSLFWRVQHDAPMVLYPGYLFISGSGVPYRDIFDVNMPGSFLLYGLIAKTVGTSDFALRTLDVLLLAVITLLGYRLFAKLNVRAALFGPLCFCLLYLSNSWWTALQREFFVILFVLLTLSLSINMRRAVLGVGQVVLRAGLCGLIAGCCALIKPQSLPVFLWIAIWGLSGRRFSSWMACLIGFLLPLIATTLYMYSSGAMAPWLDMMVNYWPLYGNIGGDIRVLAPGEKFSVVLRGLSLVGGYYSVFVVGLLASLVAFRDVRSDASNDKRQLLMLLAGIALLFWLYPAIPGQFWLYHWLPFLYFGSILVGLSLGALDFPPARQAIGLALMVAAIVVTSLLFVKPAYFQVLGSQPPVKQGRVDEIVAFLGPRLRQGDTIQPLDWTGGAVHAMLILRAPLATRYMQDFYFYHNVSSPYIQGLRRDFLLKFSLARPRFVIRVLSDDKPWPSGPDTTRNFPELEILLARDYKVVKERQDYQILERR
jgi:hypothetical protein